MQATALMPPVCPCADEWERIERISPVAVRGGAEEIKKGEGGALCLQR